MLTKSIMQDIAEGLIALERTRKQLDLLTIFLTEFADCVLKEKYSDMYHIDEDAERIRHRYYKYKGEYKEASKELIEKLTYI